MSGSRELVPESKERPGEVSEEGPTRQSVYPDWPNCEGLIPVVVQDYCSNQVLMLAYMNRAAWEETLRSGKVTFFSRSRQSLWTKGETSGNFLQLKEAYFDCDQDTLLVKAEPCGPVCHTGSTTCFGEFPIGAEPPLSFLAQLESLIWSRGADPVENSYTCRLLTEGIAKIAQKVGEEGVEVVVAALAQENDDLICESADLIFHLMVLLSCRGLSLAAVVDQLKVRHQRVTRLNQAVF